MQPKFTIFITDKLTAYSVCDRVLDLFREHNYARLIATGPQIEKALKIVQQIKSLVYYIDTIYTLYMETYSWRFNE